MNFDLKRSIIDRLRATKRKNIECVIDYMEKNGFFTRHCHHHHHYKGGLADHSWQTYQIALRLNAENCAKNSNAPILDEDSIAICALLHDFCDCSGLRDISGHGRRSVKMLKEIGFKLLQEEFLAIRFHMSLRNKETHPQYYDAKNSQLRYIVHCADGVSARLYNGYNDPDAKQDKEDLRPYFQNYKKLECKDIIFQVKEGWYMNLHSPYDGEIDSIWESRIIGVKTYDTAQLYGINDSLIGAIYVLGSRDKKALFIINHYTGMDGCYFSPDDDPFIYDDIKIFSKWYEWDSYAYATCRCDNRWKLIKVTQYPMPVYEVIADGFSSVEEAMKSVGVEDCDRYLSGM